MTDRAKLIEALAAWWAMRDGNVMLETGLKDRYVAMLAGLTDVQLGDIYHATLMEVARNIAVKVRGFV